MYKVTDRSLGGHNEVIGRSKKSQSGHRKLTEIIWGSERDHTEVTLWSHRGHIEVIERS